MSEKRIGRINHVFRKISAASLVLEEPISVGDRIHIEGHTTDMIQKVGSMQIDRKPIRRAWRGDNVAILVHGRVRENDEVYLVSYDDKEGFLTEDQEDKLVGVGAEEDEVLL
ncbi:MAG: translation elongation factor-like protein [bacterium]|nr:translation elongation factor-like protein [bacterium]